MSGARKFTEYLNAPEHVQDQFDRRVREVIKRQQESDEWLYSEMGDEMRHVPAEPLDVKWDKRWSKRAKSTRTPGTDEPYDRTTDPLLDVDLREVWEDLTGESIRFDRTRCPHPEHPDRNPACKVFADGFRCFACSAYGSIIDLGGLLYGIEPRGKGFHDIRRQLLSDLGMDEARAA